MDDLVRAIEKLTLSNRICFIRVNLLIVIFVFETNTKSYVQSEAIQHWLIFVIDNDFKLGMLVLIRLIMVHVSCMVVFEIY